MRDEDYQDYISPENNKIIVKNIDNYDETDSRIFRVVGCIMMLAIMIIFTFLITFTTINLIK